ncbi:hypothetical protein QCQ60_001210 [Bacillus cereus]|nr:hypothetical protein [Bacillus cereus]
MASLIRLRLGWMKETGGTSTLTNKTKENIVINKKSRPGEAYPIVRLQFNNRVRFNNSKFFNSWQCFIVMLISCCKRFLKAGSWATLAITADFVIQTFLKVNISCNSVIS